MTTEQAAEVITALRIIAVFAGCIFAAISLIGLTFVIGLMIGYLCGLIGRMVSKIGRP